MRRIVSFPRTECFRGQPTVDALRVNLIVGNEVSKHFACVTATLDRQVKPLPNPMQQILNRTPATIAAAVLAIVIAAIYDDN